MEQENLRQVRQASPHLEATYQLVNEFLQMVRERTGDRLEEWLGKVKASRLQAFQTFVKGVQNDKEAVLAGLTLPWSNGSLEGHVNRLKLIKRSMYGRAEFDLLKIRVLYQSKNAQERKKKDKKRRTQAGGFAPSFEERFLLVLLDLKEINQNNRHDVSLFFGSTDAKSASAVFPYG